MASHRREVLPMLGHWGSQKYFNDVSITYLHNENQTNDDMLGKRLLGELHAKTGLKRDYFSQVGRKGRLPTQKLQVRQILKRPYGFPLLLSRNASDKNFQQQNKKQNAYNTWNALARAESSVTSKQRLPISFPVKAKVQTRPTGPSVPWPLQPLCLYLLLLPSYLEHSNHACPSSDAK